MKKLLFFWIIRRWIKRAQRTYGGPNDGRFNSANFSCAMREDLGHLPPSQFVRFVLPLAGCFCEGANCHWVYPASKADAGPEHPACNDYLTEGTDA